MKKLTEEEPQDTIQITEQERLAILTTREELGQWTHGERAPIGDE